MTSYAELLQTCTEFQENFAVLNGKYNAAAETIKYEQEQVQRLQRQLEALAKSEERLLDEIRCLKKELASTQVFKDRFTAATMSLEHTKGRLESVKRNLSDANTEHQQQTEQLKGQISDLLARLDATSGETRVRDFRAQVAELEERCAIQSVQLSEERERSSQQLLAAHNALRDQQSRNLELEQRYRAMEGEVVEMRSAVRRASDLQNEGALLKEKHAAQAATAQREAEALSAEVETLRARAAQQERAHTDALAEAQRHSEESGRALRERVAGLTVALNDMTAQTGREQDKYARLQQDVQQRVGKARDESAAEVRALRTVLATAREEAQRLTYQIKKQAEETEEERRTTSQRLSEHQALAARYQELERRYDAAVQQEAWVSAQNTHLSDQLAAAQQQTQELTAVAMKCEQTNYELERAQLLLRGRDEELSECRQYAREAEQQLADLEEVANRRIKAIKLELRGYKKQAKGEAAKAESLRRRLIHTIAEREAQWLRCEYGEFSKDRGSAAASARLVAPADASAYDIIGVLKCQTEQAEQLHARLVELSGS